MSPSKLKATCEFAYILRNGNKTMDLIRFSEFGTVFPKMGI